GVRAPARPAAVLQRAPRAAGRLRPGARSHLGGCLVETEAGSRIRSRTPRTAPAPPHQGEDLAMSQPLPFRLDREIVVAAPLELVFRYFTDNERWARWWGVGSTIDATPGGAILIRHPNGVEVTGHVVSVDPPHAIAFTYGYRSGAPIPEGASLVTIRLAEHEAGTTVQPSHEFADDGVCNQHVQGWRYQMAVFANVTADETFIGADNLV